MRRAACNFQLAVYRVVINFPSVATPGAGLPAYMLAGQLPGRSLVSTYRRDGVCPPLPSRVRVEYHSYPRVELAQSTGWSLRVAQVAKAIGFLVFFLQSLPGMIRFRPDVTHIHTPTPLIHGLFARYVLRTPLCITLHGSELRHVARSRFWRWALRRASHVFCMSRPMIVELARFVPRERLSYAPNGVDSEQFTPGGDVRRNCVLMVGSFRWQKDYPSALSAFAQFLSRHPAWELQIVGSGPDLPALKSMAAELGIAGSVNFMGVKNREEIADLMRHARLFLLSSVSEGFPKVILESAASATPMVVTDVGQCRDVGRDAGIVVRASSPGEMADALSRLAGDGELWKRKSRAARALAETFSWESRTERVLRVYEGLLQKKARVLVPDPGE